MRKGYTGPSRRADPRIDDPPIKAAVKGKTESYDARIINICRRGLRFHSEGEFQKGETVSIELHITDERIDAQFSIKAHILNAYGDKSFGVKFRRIFTFYEISSIEKLIWQRLKAEQETAKETHGAQFFPPVR